MTEEFAPPPALGEGGPRRTPEPDGREPSPGAPPARRGRARRRRGVLVAWIVGGATAVAILGGVIADLAGSAAARTLEPVERGATGDVAGIQVVAGVCLRDPVDTSATVGTVRAVPCGEPHGAEAVAAYSFTVDAWPGGGAVADEAVAFCAAQVARIVPRELAAGLEWRVWAPSQGTWEAGDREAVCVVSSPAPLTGSLEAGTAAAA